MVVEIACPIVNSACSTGAVSSIFVVSGVVGTGLEMVIA